MRSGTESRSEATDAATARATSQATKSRGARKTHAIAVRTWIVAALAIVVTATAFREGRVEAGESKDARVRAAILEFTAAGTPEARRERIVAELKSEGVNAAAERTLRETIAAEPRRDASLDLACRLRCAAVFAAAKRHADGASGARVVDLAVSCGDPAAASWAALRWDAAEISSAAFRAADTVLRSRPCGAEVVDVVAKRLSDPVRGQAALLVLHRQLGCDDATPFALASRWEEARRVWAHEAKTFSASGAQLLDAPGWTLDGARPVGANLRLRPASCVDMSPLPRDVFREDGALRLRVSAAAGAGAFVSIATEGAAQDLRLRCDGKTWALVEGPPREGRRVEAPAAAGAWQEILIRSRDPQLRDAPEARDLRVLVDGVELRPSGGFWRLGRLPVLLSVGAAEGESPTLLGGVEWILCPQ